MSYGFYRLGANVAGKVLPFIGPTYGSAVILDQAPLPVVLETMPAAPTELGPSSRFTRTNARDFGFTGNVCSTCGSYEMVRNGTCEKCQSCGSTTGCS